MTLLTKQQQELYENAKIFYICKKKKKKKKKTLKINVIVKLETIVIMQVNLELLHIAHII